MTNAYTLRKHFTLGNYNTTITRSEFEARFTKTRETVTFTFGGWDGKSYDGESRRVASKRRFSSFRIRRWAVSRSCWLIRFASQA